MPDDSSRFLASMGLYVFNRDFLLDRLCDDATDQSSSHDFGKDIIPKMLADDKKLFAYRFDGYWKDVGTIKSYWEANMDLLKEDFQTLLMSKEWPTYPNEENRPPEYIGETAEITNSLISPGSFIEGEIDNSILFVGVETMEGASVKDSIILPDALIGKDVTLDSVIVMSEVEIPDGTQIVASNGDPVVISPDTLKDYIAEGGSHNG